MLRIDTVTVFHTVFSGRAIGSGQEYGPVRAVSSLSSFVIVIGLVIILSVASGMMWHDCGVSLRAAVIGPGWAS
ncbi:hypothetical protein AB0I68_33005 [Streptomyces sp. NPDC050448]|uniref:hypothetical protein n=1 Tax=Streptomyces sp. NPDC050448 TaxID=3155404 RepID=UPI0034273042